MKTIIAEDHPYDGRTWDCQCARCGSSVESEPCGACAGEGITAPGELYEQDPLWYDVDDYETCSQCGGQGAYLFCISSPEWCEANPLPGRENIKRGQIEWFTLDPEKKEDAS